MKIELVVDGYDGSDHTFRTMNIFFAWLDDQFDSADKNTSIFHRENYLIWDRISSGETTGLLWHHFASKEPAELEASTMKLMMHFPCEASDLHSVHIYHTKNFAFKFLLYNTGMHPVCYSTLEVYDDTVAVAMKLYFDLQDRTGTGAITV